MAFWQTIEFWQGVSAGILLSILFLICLNIAYNLGKESATERPEDESGEE